MCSVLGGNPYSFAGGFDLFFLLRHDLETLIKGKLPLTMLTGSDNLFRIITKASAKTERRSMIGIRAARETYHRGEISDIGWIRSGRVSGKLILFEII